ncbi:LysR substrate-binding domain-containing protein [Pseudomonas typographi]|uniref:LysR substrate-binding domain-containing protein n=1 Tax=Pseudomonas typographi TaxID=2715964 RepID=UPI001683ED6A|nr:LysR substrate-binding domain-containing protein [Pseudomonas typographi]MBD1588384.1 LysR family transcriptional regulator [Pseudomonas typographi]
MSHDWTRRIRLQHLQLLVSLVETGSISEAARTSFSTQPALSKWLKELEDDVGAPLFERHARGLKPTQQGNLLLVHARRVLSEMDRAQRNLLAVQAGNASQIVVGTTPASSPNLVPAAIMQLLTKYPQARVELQEGSMAQLLAKLELGQVDLVIGRMDSVAPRANLRSELLYDEAMKIVCRPGHPLVRERELTWEKLYGYEWIVWAEGTPIRSKLDLGLVRAGMGPLPIRVESSSMIGNLWLLQYSDMLSVASERVATHFTGQKLMVSLDFPLDAMGWLGMCWRDEPEADQALSILMDELRALANPAQWRTE